MYRLFLKRLPAALLALGLLATARLPAQAAGEDTAAPPASGAPREQRTLPPEPSVIEQLRARGLDVKSAGLIGRELQFWLVRSADGREAMVATTAEGFLLRGKIYAPDGSLSLDTEGNPPLQLTQEGRRAQGLPPLTGLPPSPETDLLWRTPKGQNPPKLLGFSGTIWDRLGHATVIEEGKPGAPIIYIFIDPYCPYCHQQWQTLRQQVTQGKLQVRWVPVAVLSGSQSNLGVVQGLLHDPSAETLAGWMRERRVRTHDSAAAKKALGLNMALFQALNARSVPVLIYKDRTGKLVTKVGLTHL